MRHEEAGNEREQPRGRSQSITRQPARARLELRRRPSNGETRDEGQELSD